MATLSRSVAFLFLLFAAAGLATQELGPRDYYSQGSEAFAKGNFFDAIEQYKLAVEKNPRYLEPIAGLASVYFYLGEFEVALEFVLQAQALDAANLDLQNLEGRIRVGLGEYNVAESVFTSILEQEPNNIEAWFGVAELDLAFGNTTQATQRYERALEISPTNRRALLALVLVLEERGQTELASPFVEQALRYYPRNSQVRYIAAKHFLSNEKIDEAAFQARRALELDPDHLDASLLLGEIYLRGGSNERALTVFEGLLGLDRNQPLVWYGLGTAFRRLDRTEEALNAFGFALRYQSDDEVSRISLEQLLLETLDLSDPRRSQFADFHFDRGVGYQDRNFLARALRSYRRGLLISPRSKRGRLLYAEVFRVQGYESKYLNELNVLVDLGHEDEDILDRIEIQESLLQESLSQEWDVDQYTLFRADFKFDLFVTDHNLRHVGAERDLASYLRNTMLHRERFSVPNAPSINTGYGEAFALARSHQSDYFMMVEFSESERLFGLSATIYSSGTGGLLRSYRVMRTGNDRVADAMNLVVDDIDELLPVSAKILDRRFDLLLIDAGFRDGVSTDDEMVIVKGDGLSLARDKIGFVYNSDDVIGAFVVGRTDELIAEGELTQSRFFDLINIGDRLVYAPEESENPIPDPRVPSSILYQSIRQLR